MNPKESIINNISEVLGIPVQTVKSIINSQFSFVTYIIKKGDRSNPDTLENVNIQYFGKFAVKPARKKYYEGLNDGGTEDID